MRREDEISTLSVTDKMTSSEADTISQHTQNKDDDNGANGRRFPGAQAKKKRRDPLAQSMQITSSQSKEKEEEMKERERLKQERTRKEIAAAFGMYTGLLGVDQAAAANNEGGNNSKK